jgi:hypothetical protein
MWGECHTFMSSRVPDDRADPIVRKHIDLHMKCFPRTQLCISDDAVGHDKPGRSFPLTDYAFSKGVSLRDLGVGPPGQAPEKSHESSFLAGHVAPTTQPGTYDVYVSAGRRDGTPTISLPLAGNDRQTRYKLGTVTLREP